MKVKIILLLLGVSHFFGLSGQALKNKKQNKWGCAIAINSIQAQVEIPLMTGSGALAVDADGNILTGGKRMDKSFSCSIIPKFHINSDILLRFEFGITNLSLKSNSDQKDGIYHVTENIIVANKIYRYAPGFQWTFMKTKKLESYCGIMASYINYKIFSINFHDEHREPKTDTLQYWETIKETTPGGFALGLGALAGFNIYLSKRISLGAELSSSALYYKLGSETTQQAEGQLLPGTVNSTVNTYANSYKGFKISKIISSFNISFWL